MAKQKDPTSPATTSDAYDRMLPRWNVIQTLRGGTEAMRAAGTALTPMNTEETQDSYDARMASTVLLNMVEQTLDSLSGKPFTEPVKVNEDVPEVLSETILDDVDLQGNNLDVFARTLFLEGMAAGLIHVLVEKPRPAKEAAPGVPRTLADDRKEGMRPYWIMIRPESVIFARAEIENGAETLKHVRILENYTIQEGFAEVCKPRIRVLEPGTVTLYEPHPTKKKNGEPVWIETDAWNTDLKYIPMVTFYAEREEFMVAKPPLLDLAWLNIAHWNSSSDQRHILKVARFPILACSGAAAEDSDPVVIGPNKVLYNPDSQGKFYYVEHTGAAIAAGREDLKSLEEQMSGYGSQLLRQKSGTETATARSIDTAESTSDLAAMAGVFEDTIAQILDITAEAMNLAQEGGTIEVVKNFNQAEDDAEGLAAIQTARQARDLSRHTLLLALKARGYLPEDFDPEVDAELLLEEQDTALARAGFNLDPLGNPKQPALDEQGNPIPPGQTKPPASGPGAKPPAKKVVKKKTTKRGVSK